MKTNFSSYQLPVHFSVKPLAFMLGFALLGLTSSQRLQASGAANDHTVLILGPTVTGGSSSVEALRAVAHGLTVEVVDNAGWAAKSQADFATYVALILGDPTCVGGTGPITAAEANRATWSPIVDGNIIVIGTDPVYHHFSQPGASTLIDNGVAFAAGQPGKTGLYCDLSCYYAGAPLQPVPVLDQIGAFETEGSPGCFNNAHIVATHPALTGLTDAGLSGWSCSVHEDFTAWPASFDVLVLALTGTAYTAPDGSVGNPYILARGAGLVQISSLTLTPGAAQNPLGANHKLTATFTQASTTGGAPTPIVGATVTFTVTSGPNTGVTGTGVTDVNGQATFTYTSSLAGTDTITATAVDAASVTHTSNPATKQWVGPPTVTATPRTNRGCYDVTASSAGYATSIYVKDSASAFVAGAYAPGTVVL